MTVTGLTIDPINNAPIVVLREDEGERILPIWIGVIEASAIAFELEKVKLARPMTHDLLRTTIEALHAEVDCVSIVDLRENTYYAMVTLTRDGRQIEIDARPSDAIALALRADAPILCAAQVLEQAHVRPGARPAAAAAVADDDDEGGPEDEALAGADGSDGSDGSAEEVSGPRPLVGSEGRSWEEIFASLEPEAFGKYKM